MRHLGLVLALLLGGCSLLQPAPESPAKPWLMQQRLAALQCWKLQAKIGVRTYTKAESAYVAWQQQDRTYRLTISGPLGIGAVRIDGDDTRVVMQAERNRMLVARDPETLLRNEFDWELPISNLYYWVRGLPAPDDPIDALRRDEQQALLSLEQAGWLLDFQQYGHHDGYRLPEKILLTNPELRVKFIVKDWESLDCAE